VKEAGLIKMCFNETHIEVRICKNLSDVFTIQRVFIAIAFYLWFRIFH
jgi:hypothetical protein